LERFEIQTDEDNDILEECIDQSIISLQAGIKDIKITQQLSSSIDTNK
jgi:hypothetical protein